MPRYSASYKDISLNFPKARALTAGRCTMLFLIGAVFTILLSKATLAQSAAKPTSTTPISRDEFCAAGKPKPGFSKDMKELKKYKSAYDTKQNYLSETFEIEDLGMFNAEQGGCAHFGTSLSFIVDRPKAEKLSAKEWLDFVEPKLKKLPSKSAMGSLLLSELVRARGDLKKATVYDSNEEKMTLIEIPDGDGYSTLNIVVTDEGVRVKIKVSRDVAL